MTRNDRVGVRDAVSRGRQFEAEVAKFLRAVGFEVTANAGIARPRQTDLFAKGDNLDILIEAKNQKRNVGVGDIDSLRARLNRTSSDIVGAIFTTSGLTKRAVEAIETDRRREVLAFVKEEIEQLRLGNQNLRALIERKRTELRVHGKAWFGPAVQLEFVGVKLPVGSVEFKIDGEANCYFESRSGLSGAIYSLEVPDTGWGAAGGEGARLEIQLALNTVADLRNIIGYLHQKFGLSRNGMFSIQQSESSWYGVGLDSFLRAAEQWPHRYSRSTSKRFHHSETLTYFDQFRDGWIELSTQQRVGYEGSASRVSFLHMSELVVQLPGVPVDTSPFLSLCRYTGNEWAHFQHIEKRWTSTTRLKKPIVMSVVGTIVNRELFPGDDRRRERIVIGVIAQNPFYRKKSTPSELIDSKVSFLPELTETELLVCALRDWHDDGNRVDCYMLQGFEVTVGGVGHVIRPFGTWNQLLKADT